jgi:hypothetical protein
LNAAAVLKQRFLTKGFWMSTIKMAFTLQHSSDYEGDRRPWHWFYGESFDELRRSSAHATEVDALEQMGQHLIGLARRQRELVAR